MQRVNVGHKALADYNSLIGRALAEEIRTLAEPLKGRRMLHLSATAFGGGVAEIQYTLIPLMIDAGIDAEWRVIQGQEEFYDVTKTIHNALQGDERGITDHQKAFFEGYNKMNADALTDADEWDVMKLHPGAGADILKEINFPYDVNAIVRIADAINEHLRVDV